jgi:hypothetical protein
LGDWTSSGSSGSRSATRYTWQSGRLTDGQTCCFTIRIATAPWPNGLEPSTLDSYTVSAEFDVPASPDFTLELI